jgi:23S rRNA (uracil1939-C5)-methyltransferase
MRSMVEGAATQHDLTVETIAADGDGLARLPNGDPAYLPYTLPTEIVRTLTLTTRGQGWTGPAEILTASPERQPAPCPHFGACGGCTLQHWQDAPYAAWKIDQIRTGLARAGFTDVPTAALARTPPGRRRRVDLALIREGRAVEVGLHRHRGREVIDLHTCLVLDPRLTALIGALRQVLPGVSGLRRTGSALANLLDSGIDLLLRTDAELSAADRIALTAMASSAGVGRNSAALNTGPNEPAAQLGPVVTALAGVEVTPPPGAFLQASRDGEAAIIAAILAGLPRLATRARIVELYAGCGTLTFALAPHARVIAYEGDPAAHAALRRASAGRRVEAIHRDLVRQPLTVKDLAGAAAIVLDPPYAGVGPQMAAVAGSGVPRVIYVSCNPAALAQDARLLKQAGYIAVQASPVDQFLWSAAVESVVVFERRRSA